MIASINKSELKKFISKWVGRGREDEDDRSYWIDLFQDVFEQSGVTDRLSFQKKVTGRDGNTKRIDVYIPETKVIIEQKSINVALDKPQAGHDGMTPFEQARMYNDGLPFSERARWIVTSNFAEIWIYDMDKRKPEEEIIKVSLSELDKQYPTLQFLFDNRVEEIRKELKVSQEAGDRIGRIYDALLAQIPGEPTEDEYKSLNLFCVRLVFCYYAEDAGLFGKYQFRDYMKGFNTKHLRNGLKDLFRVLDTKEEERDRNDEPELLAFPYVNGGLFADRNIIIPQIDEKTHELMTQTSDFNWSEISPTIFGAVFESTLNQETRRKGGMHYTSIENIHKVIDPLFLDELKEEYQTISESKQPNVKRQKLQDFQKKLGSLKFLDPASGSGNFLTETYLSLRKIENDVLRDLFELDRSINPNQIAIGNFIGAENPIKVQLSQFYGIEINDFAVSVSKTALWIAEHQMFLKTKELAYQGEMKDYLPLKSYVNVIEANALRIDWKEIFDPSEYSYIMGNPPFIGGMMMSSDQKNDITTLMSDFKSNGEMDYVTGWYLRAMQIMKDSPIKAAFVSTNSISQGQQATTFLAKMIQKGMTIHFAYPTFIWDSEATLKAHVHCCIIGFSFNSKCESSPKRRLYFSDGGFDDVNSINQYLSPGPFVTIESRSTPLCNVPSIRFGSMPRDGGGFILSEDEKNSFIKNNPQTKKWIKQYLGAEEFLKGKKRYCLWLKDVNPSEYINCPNILNRIEKVRNFRLSSKAASTRKFADTPAVFCQIAQPENGNYIAVPEISSERRKYIPFGFLHSDIIASNLLFLIPDANIYHFGILESSVHMAWMRTVAGRLEMRYRYSKDIVYNNFPWPTPTDDQKAKIEQTAQAILDAREKYNQCSLAELYGDKMYLFADLVKAHEANDKAVMKAYGFEPSMEEPEIVAELMKMYQNLTEGEK